MKKVNVNIILAIDSNFVIGNNNDLPWPKDEYKEDLQHFRKITSDTDKTNYLICGYKTYESMKDLKLKKRRLIIINKKAAGMEFHGEGGDIHVKDFEQAIQVCSQELDFGRCDKIFVIGGKKTFEDCIKESYSEYFGIEKLYLTQIKKSYQGDVKINPDYLSCFRLTNVKKLRNMHFCEYAYYRENYNHPDYQYFDIIESILKRGIDCDDRTGVGIKSIFGTQMKFDLTETFPLLTTKKMFTRGITEELLWFLRGETDAKILQEKKVRIWDGNSTREFLDNRGLNNLEEGDIGAAYGFQFRHFGAKYIDCYTDYTGQGFDQVQYVLDQIKNNPNSRRIVLSLWNPPDLKNAVLPPCHMTYQFRVYGDTLSCSMYQRSGDIGLGVPFNIASASLMTYLFAHMTGLKPGTLVHTIGDAHIYKNHIKAMEEQINRIPLPPPKLKIKDRGQKKIEDYLASDFEIFGYISHPRIKMDMAI